MSMHPEEAQNVRSAAEVLRSLADVLAPNNTEGINNMAQGLAFKEDTKPTG